MRAAKETMKKIFQISMLSLLAILAVTGIYSIFQQLIFDKFSRSSIRDLLLALGEVSLITIGMMVGLWLIQVITKAVRKRFGASKG